MDAGSRGSVMGELVRMVGIRPKSDNSGEFARRFRHRSRNCGQRDGLTRPSGPRTSSEGSRAGQVWASEAAVADEVAEGRRRRR